MILLSHMATKTKSNAGRKPLLTKEVEDEYFKALRLGLSQERSAKWAGVAVNTIKNWLKRGEAACSIAASKRTPFEQKCLEFLRAHDQVESEWLFRSEMVFNLAQAPGENNRSWAEASIEERRLAFEAAKFKATHQAPDEYSTKTRTELTGKDGGPVEVDVDGGDIIAMLREVKGAMDEV